MLPYTYGGYLCFSVVPPLDEFIEVRFAFDLAINNKCLELSFSPCDLFPVPTDSDSEQGGDLRTFLVIYYFVTSMSLCRVRLEE